MNVSIYLSHTRQFVISFITTVTIHYTLSFSLQDQTHLFHKSIPPLTGLTPWTPAVFRFLGHVGFNFGIVC